MLLRAQILAIPKCTTHMLKKQQISVHTVNEFENNSSVQEQV